MREIKGEVADMTFRVISGGFAHVAVRFVNEDSDYDITNATLSVAGEQVNAAGLFRFITQAREPSCWAVLQVKDDSYVPVRQADFCVLSERK